MNLLKDLNIDSGYIEWQINRLNFVINMYGENFFHNKKILELGSYQGGVTQMFNNLGAKITGVEASTSNINFARDKYPHLTFIQEDCDTAEWKFDDHYDIIIHWGLLYHLDKIKDSIVSCLKHTSLLLLETIVLDKTNSEKMSAVEDTTLPDQSIHGLGSRPTVKYVEDILDENKVVYKRHDNSSLNSKYQPHYDEPIGNTGKQYRKFWTIES